MKIELEEKDCPRFEDKSIFAFVAACLVIGVPTFIAGCTMDDNVFAQGDQGASLVAVLVLIAGFALIVISIAILFTLAYEALLPLSRTEGFFEASKRKMEQAYGIDALRLDRTGFYRAVHGETVSCYAIFDEAPSIYEQVLVNIDAQGARHEATLDAHLLRSVPADAAKRFSGVDGKEQEDEANGCTHTGRS